MSTKGTLIFTNYEHWYEETSQSNYDDNGKFIGFDVCIDVDKQNIVSTETDNDGVYICIKGSSEIARKIVSLSRHDRELQNINYRHITDLTVLENRIEELKSENFRLLEELRDLKERHA